MKKLYLLAAMLLTFCGMQAQNFTLYCHGEALEDGARVDLMKYWSEDKSWYNPELTLDPAISGQLTVDVDYKKGNITPALDADWYYGYEGTINFCAIDGICLVINPGKTSQKVGPVTANTPVEMATELVVMKGDKEKSFTYDIDAEFTYKCTLGGESKTYTFFAKGKQGDENGVDAITLDPNAPAEYYDLQGRKVANPENGLYIIRQGGKAFKQIIK
ncbi:MAG: hypothetical protein NC328_07425 [Muribaculum sp.]|nr:hypothetical protein [Muribaculum sp.]